MSAIDYSKLPAGLRAGFRTYVERGVPPGSFICAVLKNDLAGATMRADPSNLAAMPSILRWLRWNVPGACWGSTERFSEWCDMDDATRNSFVDHQLVTNPANR